MTIPQRNNASEEHCMPSLMAVSRVKLSSPGSVPVGCLHEREWASIGGAESEAYGDMIVEMA